MHRFLLLEVAETEAVFPEGRQSSWQVAAYLDRVTAVAVLGHLPTTGELIMVENYRPSLARWSLEVAGGLPEPGEPLADAARREFEEETGFAVDLLVAGPTLHSLPGLGYFPIACFIARAGRRNAQALDPNERIRPVVFPASVEAVQNQKSRVFEPVSLALLDHFLRMTF